MYDQILDRLGDMTLEVHGMKMELFALFTAGQISADIFERRYQMRSEEADMLERIVHRVVDVWAEWDREDAL